MRDLFEQMYNNSTTNNLALSNINNYIQKAWPQLYKGFLQHDSEEILMDLLQKLSDELNVSKYRKGEDAIQIDMNAVDSNKDMANSITSWKNYINKECSIIGSLITGQIRVSSECPECKSESNNFEIVQIFQLPIKCKSQLYFRIY